MAAGKSAACCGAWVCARVLRGGPPSCPPARRTSRWRARCTAPPASPARAGAWPGRASSRQAAQQRRSSAKQEKTAACFLPVTPFKCTGQRVRTSQPPTCLVQLLQEERVPALKDAAAQGAPAECISGLGHGRAWGVHRARAGGTRAPSLLLPAPPDGDGGHGDAAMPHPEDAPVLWQRLHPLGPDQPVAADLRRGGGRGQGSTGRVRDAHQLGQLCAAAWCAGSGKPLSRKRCCIAAAAPYKYCTWTAALWPQCQRPSPHAPGRAWGTGQRTWQRRAPSR